MKLRSKILSYTLPIILIPLLVMALAVYYFVVRANQIQIQEERKQSLNEAVAGINQEAKAVQKDLEVLSKVPVLKLFLADAAKKVRREGLETTETQAKTVLELFFERNPYYLELSLCDLSGKELVRLNKRSEKSELRSLGDKEFFRRTLITETSESPAYEFEPDRFAFIFTRSVKDTEFLGMVVLKLDSRSFVRSMRPLLARNLQTFLFDERGLVLASSLNSNASRETIQNIDLAKGAASILQGSPPDSLSKSVSIEGRAARFSFRPAHSSVQVGTLEKPAGSFWFLGVFEPAASGGMPSTFQVIFFSTVLLTIGGVLWAAASASRRITIPLERVSRATSLIARGQADLQLDVNTGDEVEDLANALSKMNSELRDYQKRLVQSTKLATMGEMTSEISHEIQNRISGISLWLQHLDSEIEEDDPKREYLDEMKQGLAGFMEMLGSLKNYYRDPVLTLEDIDLNSLVSDSIPFVQEKLDAKRAVVNEQFGSDLPAVKGDADKLKSVVVNLLINAADSLSEGGQIDLNTRIANGEEVSLEISDNGKGIGEKEISRIFYPFFSTKSGGSGLGLSISSNIISAHKGTIEVESEVGKGTTFKILLPASDRNSRS